MYWLNEPELLKRYVAYDIYISIFNLNSVCNNPSNNTAPFMKTPYVYRI